MKLNNLIKLYENKMDEIDRDFDNLLNAANEGETSFRNNNNYPNDLSYGEELLSDILTKFEFAENLLFHINNTQNKVNIPELGMSISCALDSVFILNKKLLLYRQLGEILSITDFEFVKQDPKTSKLDIEIVKTDKGFNLGSIDNSINYLEETIKEYNNYINKAIENIELVIPEVDNSNSFENTEVITKLLSKKGTSKVKKQNPEPTEDVEIDLSEYSNSSAFLDKVNNNNDEFVVKHVNLSNNRHNIKNISNKSFDPDKHTIDDHAR